MKEKIGKYLNKKTAIIIIAVCIVILIAGELLSEKGTDLNSAENGVDFDFSETYKEEMTKHITELVENIDGAGRCKVYLTVSDSGETVYGQNKEIKTEKNDNEFSEDNKSEYLIYEEENGQKALSVMKYYPKVDGVAIVCEGGDDTGVKIRIINSVKALLSLPANRISVEKLKI